MKTSAVFIA
jgi:hypothetical protein